MKARADGELGPAACVAIGFCMLLCLAIAAAIFGPIVLVLWKFAFWVLS